VEICGYAFVYQDEAAASVGSVSEEDTGSSVTPSSDLTSVLDGSTTTWMMRGDVHSQHKLWAWTKLTQDLRKILTLDELLSGVLEGLLTLASQAERALLVLRETGSGRPATIRVRHRGSDRISDVAQPGKLLKDAIATGKPLLSDQGQAVSAPLLDLEGKPLGAVQLDAWTSQRRFKTEDLDLLATVAFQISFLVENAILHEAALRERSLETELKLAQEIQVVLLPSQPPQIDGYEFFDYYAPAKYVGGDYYDYLLLEDNRLALVVGDVSGKGIPAALLMVKVASELGASLATEPDPVAVLNQVNQRFSRRNPDGAFVTMVLAVLDLSNHRMTIVNAGHIRPLLRRPDGSIVEIGDTEAGMPLGVMPSRPYEQTELDLGIGDALVLVSDGITEAQSAHGRQYGQQRLVAQLTAPLSDTAADLGRRIIGDVDHFVGNHPQSDDRCLLCIKRNA
jgi:serine phosphatase RsbU (regulator of sigma subunit)